MKSRHQRHNPGTIGVRPPPPRRHGREERCTEASRNPVGLPDFKSGVRLWTSRRWVRLPHASATGGRMASADAGKGNRTRPARKARGRSTVVVATIAVVVGAVVVGYFAYRAQANLPGRVMADQGNLHIDSATQPHEPYNSDPPTSGRHLPHIPPWGVHHR